MIGVVRRHRWYLLAAVTALTLVAIALLISGRSHGPRQAAVERLHKIHLGMARAEVDKIMKDLGYGMMPPSSGPFTIGPTTTWFVEDDWVINIIFDKDGKVEDKGMCR